MRRALLVWLAAIALCGNARGAGPAGRGEPWPRHAIDDSSRGADGVRLADVNGDGLMDIATGWEEGGRVRAYLNPGPAKAKAKWPAVTVGQVRSPEDAVFADLDGDGATDVVSSCEGRTRSLFVHWAPKDKAQYLDAAAWTTEAFPVAKGAKMWMFALPLQLDGEHGVDLVVGAKGGGAQIGWLRSPANPRDLAAWTWHPLYEAAWIMSLIASDVDGDGDLDVVATDRKGAKRAALWLENPGPGPAQAKPWKTHRIGAAGKQVMFMTLADLDHDGLQDAVVAVSGKELAFLRRRQAKPPAWEPFVIELPRNTGMGKGVAVGDIDLDGKPDVVFTCEHAQRASGVLWLSYRKAPTERAWDAHEISGPVGVKYDRVELIDLDGDGDLDVLSCEERTNLGVIWYENPTR